ncbi:MAG: LysM peptidoglycan-binding domain-containing protein [Bacteroidota bacterium]
MKNLVWILFVCMSFSTFAQRYVLFNPNCMERLKYDVINGYGGESYIIYTVELNDQEKVFLEVGKDEGKSVNRIARAVITCNSASINKNMVNRINNNVGEKYAIVLKEGSGKFRVADVKAASYYKNTERGIEYVGKDYAFTYDSWKDTPSQNLADPNYGGRVFFVGNSQYECFEANTFSISTSSQADSDVGLDLTVIPEIGVLEYRTNLSGSNGTKRLATVNAKTFRSIVQDRCQGRDFDPALSNRNTDKVTPPVTTTTPPKEELTARSDTRTSTPVTTSSSNNTTTTATTDYGMIARRTAGTTDNTAVYDRNTDNRITTNNTTSTSDVHVVAKGETLYRIAKKYGLSVARLQSLNRLNNNTIFPGDRLYIAEKDETLSARGNSGMIDDRNNSNTVSGTNARNTDWPADKDPAWENTDGYHTFQRGESVAGIARLYGYTEARFRALNALRPNENVPIGYRLKTTDCDYQAPTNDTRNDSRDDFTSRSVDDDFNDGYGDDFRTSVNTPAPYNDNRYGRISDNTGNRDYRKAASPATYSEGSGLSIRFDRQTQLHLVKENETLYSIARKYNTSVTKLADANNLDPREVLLPGQSIFIK